MSIIVRHSSSLTEKASFRTHLNYVKRIGKLFQGCALSVSKHSGSVLDVASCRKFHKLHKITERSITKEIELSREDKAFALLAAPWFPVKCYYSLYYLESILLHLIDGNTVGFSKKGGHKGVRKRIRELLMNGTLSFSDVEMNQVHSLEVVSRFPAIRPGQNTTTNFWQDSKCTASLFKKLKEYSLHSEKFGKKTADKAKKKKHLSQEMIALPDFFYWYRIKANYRDLDYIDFEEGISEAEAFEYLDSYYKAYVLYRNQLTHNIAAIRKSFQK